ncbi:nuclear transport factor 2 family protein [Agaribacter flavus]|uniref:Ester cyclase n=1 Tax=Agaribacter flavus TaxID=1902781 RepID=A0ABV7FQ75_9ALTE
MSVVEQFYKAVIINSTEVNDFVDKNTKWHVSAPVNEVSSMDDWIQACWLPLTKAFEGIERRTFISLSEVENDVKWTFSTGVFVGNFNSPLFGIPHTGKAAYLRFTEMVAERDGKIIEGYTILDMLDLMEQAGVNPLRKSLGKSGTILPPSTLDGVNPPFDSKEQGQITKQLVIDMLNELGRFDGESLSSMKLENYWDPNFIWYGPAGIGTTRGIEDFRQQHQGPFVFSFPDRIVDHHTAFIAQGNYAATGGWPHMHGTHSCGGWLGLPPSGKYLELRVMDIWRREGNLLKENWVAIDLVHMCEQMGLDVFAMMHTLSNGNNGANCGD